MVVFTAGKRRGRWNGNSTLGGFMGGAEDFNVGKKTGFASGASETIFFVPPLFQMWGRSKQISVGAY